MARNPKNLHAFVLADDLVPELYKITRVLPAEERYGLQAQVRRAAVSVPTNLVEGCARRGEADYCRFVEIAYSSACDTSYLIRLAVRLEFLAAPAVADLLARYDQLQASLHNLIGALSTTGR